jgi:hypothetical protein
MTDKPVEIKFAPGCFDHFEGTQEELDELMKEITEMFSNMTPEELKAQSRTVDLEELIEDGDIEFVEQLMKSNEPRNLQ